MDVLISTHWPLLSKILNVTLITLIRYLLTGFVFCFVFQGCVGLKCPDILTEQYLCRQLL